MGKATAMAYLSYPPFENYYGQFDIEIYNILIAAHQEFVKTKITDLEVECSLVILRYLCNFKQ